MLILHSLWFLEHSPLLTTFSKLEGISAGKCLVKFSYFDSPNKVAQGGGVLVPPVTVCLWTCEGGSGKVNYVLVF